MHKFSVLIVDDDEVDRYSLKRLLKSLDYEISTDEAHDGVAALEFFREHQALGEKCGEGFPPLIVFLDINMPRMNGFGFLQEFAQLRQQADRYDSVVFMMITSSDDVRDKDRANEFEFVKGYIDKMPRTGEELLAQIKPQLEAENITPSN